MDWLDIFSVIIAALDNVAKVEVPAAISPAIAAILSLAALLLALRVLSRQQRLNRRQLRLHHADHIIAWSQTCIALTAEVLEHLTTQARAQLQPLQFLDFVRIRARLGAQINAARLHFPNRCGPCDGAHKQAACTGHRQPILDHLVDADDVLANIQASTAADTGDAIAVRCNEIRRACVCDVQAAIDPRTFNRVRAWARDSLMAAPSGASGVTVVEPGSAGDAL